MAKKDVVAGTITWCEAKLAQGHKPEAVLTRLLDRAAASPRALTRAQLIQVLRVLITK